MTKIQESNLWYHIACRQALATIERSELQTITYMDWLDYIVLSQQIMSNLA